VTTRIAVIGAGPGGYVAAVRAAQLGGRVRLIEKETIGGTCLHWGCIPSKIMKTSAELFAHIGRADEFGIRLSGAAEMDMQALMARKARIIQTQVKGIEALLQHHDVRLLKGAAQVTGPGVIAVTAADGSRQTVEWDRLILATGTTPTPLPGTPFDGCKVISSNEALTLTAVPESMLIVGGGVIGCEFACILSALGTRVTIVEALERLLPLPAIDADTSKVLSREMKKRKIKVLTGHSVRQVVPDDNGLAVTAGPLQGEGSEQRFRAAQMLVCIGRRPVTAGLGLDAIGLTCDLRGWIAADSGLRTHVPDVYAIGDILGPDKIMLAHVASKEGLVAAENAMGANRTMHYDAVPSAIFTMPEVAAVGLAEEQARARGFEAQAETVLFRVIGKAQVMGELAGEAKIVFENHSGRVLGVHLIGPHATDLIAEATLAVTTRRTIFDVAETIHAHPTLAEIMGEVAMKAAGRALHG
jgi:dihydrolipoamide dehydrogenase